MDYKQLPSAKGFKSLSYATSAQHIAKKVKPKIKTFKFQ